MPLIDQKQSTKTVLKGVAFPDRAGVFDLTISNGQIAAIVPSGDHVERLLTPLLADAHVHLDKTYTVSRTGSGAGSLFEAIDRMDADKSNWTAEDLHERAFNALEDAWKSGVVAMRSHVDWMSRDVPTAWGVLTELRKTWRGRVDLQLAALTPLDILAEIGPDIAARIKADDGVMGAFVFRNDGLADKLSGVFALARKHDLALDFHVDEGLDFEAQGFDAIVGLAGQATSVLCGHACALSVRPDNDVRRVLAAAAKAGVGLVVLPTTNSYLQDNQPNRTPRQRGIAPLHEARAEGVEVLLATDNVRDVFFPYGSYDLFDLFRTAVHLAHLSPNDWFRSISTDASKWCGSTASTKMEVGNPASFLEIDACDLEAALSAPAANRKVWLNGRTIQ